MLDQKEIVHRIYRAIFDDPNWLVRYGKNPDQVLAGYGLSEANVAVMRRILALFI